MADKQITVAVPEERVPEFYSGSRTSSRPSPAPAVARPARSRAGASLRRAGRLVGG